MANKSEAKITRAENLRLVQERDGKLVYEEFGEFYRPAADRTTAVLRGFHYLTPEGKLKPKLLRGFPPEFEKAEMVLVWQDEPYYLNVSFALPNEDLDSSPHYYICVRDPDAPEDE